MVSISACHAEDPGSIPGGGVCIACLLLTQLQPIGAQLQAPLKPFSSPLEAPATATATATTTTATTAAATTTTTAATTTIDREGGGEARSVDRP